MLEPTRGARTPHGLGSDDSEMESAARKPTGVATFIAPPDTIEPLGGAVLKCEGERQYQKLMKDFHGLAIVAERRSEEPIPWEETKRRVRKDDNS